MNNIEQRFWEFITWFGWLPGILIPVWYIIAIISHSIIQNTIISDGALIHLGWCYNNQIIALLLSCLGIFMSYSIGIIIKYFYYKPRPIPRDKSTLWKRINAWSMPSIHASNSLITACALSIATISLTNWAWKYLIMTGWFCYYLSIALSRIMLKKHYPIDVLSGSLLGLIVTIVIVLTSNVAIEFIEPVIYYIIQRY